MTGRDPRASSVESFVDSAEARHALYRRSLTVVLISQIFGGAGLAAGVTVGALLAQDMLGGAGVAGLPVALFTLGSALAAYLVGRHSQRAGRRQGLAAGFLAGTVGAVRRGGRGRHRQPAPCSSSRSSSTGPGPSTNLQARYAGTDLAPVDQRATAVSVAMVSTTFGAVAGPNLVELMGRAGGLHRDPGAGGAVPARRLSPSAWPARSCSCSSGPTPTWWPRPSSAVRRARQCPAPAPTSGSCPSTEGVMLRRGRHGPHPDRDGRDHDDDAGAHAPPRPLAERDRLRHRRTRRRDVPAVPGHRSRSSTSSVASR